MWNKSVLLSISKNESLMCRWETSMFPSIQQHLLISETTALVFACHKWLNVPAPVTHWAHQSTPEHCRRHKTSLVESKVKGTGINKSSARTRDTQATGHRRQLKTWRLFMGMNHSTGAYDTFKSLKLSGNLRRTDQSLHADVGGLKWQ